MTICHFLAAQHLTPLPPVGKPSMCGFSWEAKSYFLLQKPREEAIDSLPLPLADGACTGV